MSASFHEDSDAVRRLFGIMYAYVREQQAERASECGEFVNSLTLRIGCAAEDISRQEDCVKLMTIHASKGLEFSCVYHGESWALIRPGPGIWRGGEERRLFLGITRAKDHLNCPIT